MTIAKNISFESINQRLSYDPLTGIFIWKKNFHSSKVGCVAGYKNKRGYIYVKIDGALHHAARLAWLLTFGEVDPEKQIDHINRVRDDNRISNLRLTTASENCINRNTWLGECAPRYYTQHKCGALQVEVRGKYIGLAWDKDSAIAMATQALAKEKTP